MANFISVISCGCVRGGVGTCRGHLPPPFPCYTNAGPLFTAADEFKFSMQYTRYLCNYVIFCGSILYILMILCKENQTKQILGICLSHWKNEFVVNHSEMAVYIHI